MKVAYLDASAAMKLVVEEPETEPLFLELINGRRRLVSSWLLHTELHCAAERHPEDIDFDTVHGALSNVDLVDLTRGDLMSAAAQARLRSNDAIHLAVALRLGATELLTYDKEMAEAASRAGLEVVSPAANSGSTGTL